MKNSKKLLNKFQKFNGVTFISLNNYESKTSKEVANHTINIGLSVMNAKLNDLAKLKEMTESQLLSLSESKGIAFDIFKTALSELISSFEKNTSPDMDDRTNQSKGQTDAYIQITNAIKMHKESMAIHIFGQAISKKVIIAGEYKTVKSNDKTLAKNAIKKELNLSSDKFRTFIVENINDIKMQGETLEIN